MNVKLLKDGSSKPVLLVPEGIKVKNVSSFYDEMFFVLAEAPSEKSDNEIEFEKEAKELYERIHHNSTNPFRRKVSSMDREFMTELLMKYEHASAGLQLERLFRMQRSSRLYLGDYGDLKPAQIYDHFVETEGTCMVKYGLNSIEGKLFVSCKPENNHEGFKFDSYRAFFLNPNLESQSRNFAIHNRKKLELIRRV